MEALLQDLRYAARALRASPGFTAVAVLTLALGIGANTAIFSLVNGVLLRPLPYRDAERLVVAGISIPDYRDVREQTAVFDRMALWASNRYKLTAGGAPEEVIGAVVSEDFFPLLGAAALGRTFRPEEQRATLAVISDNLWRRRFGADPDVLGRSLGLGDKTYTVIGVMPPAFEFPDASFEVWVPLAQALDATPEQAENRSLRIWRALAHLKPGVTLARAQAELDAISARLEKEHPATNAGVVITFESLYARIVGGVRPALLVLLCAVGFILLIACANVANLLLVRTAARGREMALRAALGAGRWRVARQLLTESVLLAGLGGLAGLLIGVWAIDLLPRLDPADIPRLRDVKLDGRVLLFTLGASLATGILFGMAPAMDASRRELTAALRAGGRGAVGEGGRSRLRGALVVAEVALALVVLVGAGLLVQSFTRLLRQEPGFDAERVLTANLELWRYDDIQRRAVVLDQVLDRIARIPGVEAVGGGSGLPPQTAQRGTAFAIAGRTDLSPEELGAYFLVITPDYFRALGTPVLRGRAFQPSDDGRAAPVVIVNEGLARRFFPNADPIGRRIQLVNPEQDRAWRTIVGVVGDVRYEGLDDPGEAAIYTPFAQTPFLWSYLMVRSRVPPRTLAAPLRSAIESVDPDLSPARIQPMEELVAGAVAQRRFHMLILASFAFLALLLAGVGIYAVVAYGVTQRTREIGVRMALGAARGDVLGLVVRQGMGLALAGVLLGIAGAVAATRVMASLLYGVTPTDPATIASVALLLLGLALAASYVPARRATRLDPLVALRHE